MKSSEKEALVHECLVKNYGKYYKIAYSYTFHEQDAMDVVQEGAYRAILKSDSLKQPEYADTWICRIMIREAIRFLEKNRGKTVDLAEIPEEELETIGRMLDLNVNTVKSRLYRAMDKLKKYMETGGANYGKMEKGV